MRRKRRGRYGCNETKGGGGVGVIGRRVGRKMRGSKRRRRGRRGGGEEEGRMGRRMGG